MDKEYVKGYQQGKKDYADGKYAEYSIEPTAEFNRGYNAGWDVAKTQDDLRPVDTSASF